MKSADTSLRYKLRLVWTHKDVLRNHCKPVFRWYARHFRRCQMEAAHRLQGKERLEVAFMLTIPGMWKADYLFEAMRDNPRYHPYVVVYPYSSFKGFDAKEVEATLQRTVDFVKGKGFECVVPRDESTGRWDDIRKTLKPDIVIFTSPYKDFPSNYFIYHFKHTLTCYIPYGFSSLNIYKTNYDLIFHNLVGMHFVETEIHRQCAASHSRNHGENIVVTGYPGTEVFLRNDYRPSQPWKNQSTPKRRVIWAPHHTIDGDFAISSFLRLADEMPKLAAEFADKIQFVFKPHQLLKFKLQNLWGAEKTNNYYRQWDLMDNTQLEESSYVDLFLTSDAMIHDCGSFTTEYLFTRKPVMYIVGDDSFVDKFSVFGLKSFQMHYHGKTVDDIRRFLSDVVVGGNDPMRKQRETFFSAYLSPRSEKMPSECIIDEIEKVISNKQ